MMHRISGLLDAGYRDLALRYSLVMIQTEQHRGALEAYNEVMEALESALDWQPQAIVEKRNRLKHDWDVRSAFLRAMEETIDEILAKDEGIDISPGGTA